VLTWKIVVPAKVSVLYIYIDNLKITELQLGRKITDHFEIRHIMHFVFHCK